MDLTKWRFEDARMPTDAERGHLARLMYLAFCDLRALANERRNEQARDLADAFHNVPLQMHRDDFSFQMFRRGRKFYQESWKDRMLTDYLKELDKMTADSSAL